MVIPKTLQSKLCHKSDNQNIIRGLNQCVRVIHQRVKFKSQITNCVLPFQMGSYGLAVMNFSINIRNYVMLISLEVFKVNTSFGGLINTGSHVASAPASWV